MTAEETLSDKLTREFEIFCERNPRIQLLRTPPGRWHILWLAKIRHRVLFKVRDNWWSFPKRYLV